MVRHSGEIPEIALHSAFYYLTEDPDGPRLQLGMEEIQYLQEAAAVRYQEIILRDLCYENRSLPIYRGVRRAIFNWHRFLAFHDRQTKTCDTLDRPANAICCSLQGRLQSDRSTTAKALLLLLKKTVQTTDITAHVPVFNCTFHDLTLFARELGIAEELPEQISLLCDASKTDRDDRKSKEP